jgi:mRNA interferase MazF
MSRPADGNIVLVDWRRGSLPKEPTRLRPAVVVEDSGIFDDTHPNLIVVPLTTDVDLAIPALSVAIDPKPQNGCPARSYALAFNVTSVSRERIRPTRGRVTTAQLDVIREKIAVCIGLS